MWITRGKGGEREAKDKRETAVKGLFCGILGRQIGLGIGMRESCAVISHRSDEFDALALVLLAAARRCFINEKTLIRRSTVTLLSSLAIVQRSRLSVIGSSRYSARRVD